MGVSRPPAEVGVPTPRARRGYAPLSLLFVIWCGGTVGAGIRVWLEGAFAAGPTSWPWVTMWINLGGSFLLGLLQESLLRTGADGGWRRKARMGLGTGLLGGFTTYSAFVIEIDTLARDGAAWLGLAYAVGSVVMGLACALGGILLARRVFAHYLAGGAA